MKCSMVATVLILLVHCDHAKPRPRRLSNKFIVQNFICKIDETLCQNLFCNFTVLEDFSTNLTVSYEFKKIISKITFQVTMKNYIHTGHVYKEYKVWPSIDFCLLAKGMSMPFVDYGLPNFRKNMGTTLHECPYSGVFNVTNLSVPQQTMTTVQPVGEKYLTEVIFKKGKFLPFFTMSIYEVVK